MTTTYSREANLILDAVKAGVVFENLVDVGREVGRCPEMDEVRGWIAELILEVRWEDGALRLTPTGADLRERLAWRRRVLREERTARRARIDAMLARR